MESSPLRSVCKLLPVAAAAALLLLAGCRPPLPASKPLSELTPQELHGHQVFVENCARCHHANDTRALHGPGLQALFKQQYLPSGFPANDERATYVILHGYGMMPSFGNTMSKEQLRDLLAYLHTL
jgi:mono/diheme cytochrome c family protein